MRFTATAIAFISIISLISARKLGHGDYDEFTSLGCPDTTKPYASHLEQLAAWDDFTDLLYNQKRITDAFAKYAATGYINHSPLVTMNGTNATIAELVQIVPNVTPELRHSYVSWDKNGTTFGTAHTKVTGGEKAGIPDSALVDIIRMDGTCLVEHWDALEVINASAPNPIAYF
jgi:predicted SnoaL-like aldol condensation-catalyzing enzyme